MWPDMIEFRSASSASSWRKEKLEEERIRGKNVSPPICISGGLTIGIKKTEPVYMPHSVRSRHETRIFTHGTMKYANVQCKDATTIT